MTDGTNGTSGINGTLPPSHERWPRNDWDRHRAQVRATNRARYKAIQQLVAENQEEFDQLYAEQCALEDPVVIPRSVEREDPQVLKQEIARLQAQLDQVNRRG